MCSVHAKLWNYSKMNKYHDFLLKKETFQVNVCFNVYSISRVPAKLA